MNAATQKQELDALLADAFAKADAAIAKAEEAIKKSEFTTEAMKAKKEENERLLDEVLQPPRRYGRALQQDGGWLH